MGVSLIHLMGYKDQTRVIRIGTKQSSLLTHLTSAEPPGESSAQPFRKRMMSTVVSAGSLEAFKEQMEGQLGRRPPMTHSPHDSDSMK